MSQVRRLGKDAVHEVHGIGNVTIRGLDDRVIVIAHEAIGHATNAIAFRRFSQHIQEPAAITVVNDDGVTQRAGPFLVGPGQTFIQRFPSAGDYPITCTVDDAESILVTVR